ncbi:MAG TPA: aconitase X catalytic domain-containing protein [Methanoregulaceae archaeon]|nr:aconitase X catalytic domain-containing protein [Methanoregulaceae archaeon]
MHLDPEDERVLAGESGETRRQMLELVVALGKVFGAERLVAIKSAQVSGASYKTIGKYGLEWLEQLDAKAVVPAVLNPVGMPRGRWREMGIDPEFAKKQEAVIAAYERLGIRLECTCTPYYLENPPQPGDHLAWSESSAVSYANSVLGARTNREGGPSALAAALVGKTACYGLHLRRNRRPQVRVHVDAGDDLSIAHFGALGYAVGKLIGNRIPYFTGIRPDADRLKALGAAMAATGAVALYHVEGVTPEAVRPIPGASSLETITIGRQEIDRLFSDIPVDAVAVGCPHCSSAELARIADLISGKRVRLPFYVFAAQAVIDANQRAVAAIEKSGARVYADTCMVVSPVMERYKAIMVNSGKALAYVPDMCGGLSRIGTIEECVRVGTE